MKHSLPDIIITIFWIGVCTTTYHRSGEYNGHNLNQDSIDLWKTTFYSLKEWIVLFCNIGLAFTVVYLAAQVLMKGQFSIKKPWAWLWVVFIILSIILS